jgi:hypothetical protein
MLSKLSVLACFVFVTGMVPRASATLITTYTDEPTWAAATAAGFTSIPFTGAFFGPSLTLSGATFTTDGTGNLQVINTTGSSFWDYGTGWAIDPVSSGQPVIHVTLAAGVTSFGLNITTVSPNNDHLTITANDVTYNVPSFSPSGGGFAFFGATFDAPITSFDIKSTAGDFLFADNISFGTVADTPPPPPPPSETPEVASLFMIGSGLVGMRLLNKRMHLFGA